MNLVGQYAAHLVKVAKEREILGSSWPVKEAPYGLKIILLIFETDLTILYF